MTRTIAILGALVASAAFFYGPSVPVTIRAGAFPNITTAQAMAGKAYGWFEKGLGPNVKIEGMTFNAGPSAMEARFAGCNRHGVHRSESHHYVRSQGEALRVVAGAASGGASLVVRNDSGVNKPEDFHGKRVASPQLGNPQDVALRAWWRAHGMTPTGKGGDVQVLPMANADQLTVVILPKPRNS